jgi:hypothetical protein
MRKRSQPASLRRVLPSHAGDVPGAGALLHAGCFERIYDDAEQRHAAWVRDESVAELIRVDIVHWFKTKGG